MSERTSNIIAFTIAVLLSAIAFVVLFTQDVQPAHAERTPVVLIQPTELAQGDEAKLILVHSWYPFNCCAGHDCAPITHWQSTPDGGAIVTTQHGTFKLSRQWIEENSQPSQDWESHLCVRCLDWQNGHCVAQTPRNKCMFIGGGV